MAIFEKDLLIAEQLVITEGRGMEEVMLLTGEQRRERWRKEVEAAGVEAEKKVEPNKPVRVEVAELPDHTSAGGAGRSQCGARRCKGHQGGARKLCAGQGGVALNFQHMRSLTETEIRDMHEKQRLKIVKKAEELAKAQQEDWQQQLQLRAREAAARVNAEPEPSCVRGARAYLPTRR
jgi:hypothetical protein